MSLDLDLTFPIRDVPSADLMRLKATCLWNAGIIDAGERKLVQQRAARLLRGAGAVFSNGQTVFGGEGRRAPPVAHRQAAARQDHAQGQARPILRQSPP